MATFKQVRYAESLIRDRVIGPKAQARLEQLQPLGEHTPHHVISALIQYLREQPVNSGAYAPIPEVPEGRYAVQKDGALRFYKIDRPTEGKWAGRTFVNVQHSDDFSPVRDREERRAILAAIAKNPEAALRAYGHQLGVCGVCGRTLTDEISRANGIGPICAANGGYSFSDAGVDTTADAEAPAIEEQWREQKAVQTFSGNVRRIVENEISKSKPGDLPVTFEELAQEVS